YIGFEPSEIRLPIAEEDIQEFCKIIADQEKMTDIVTDEYRFLLRYGHNDLSEKVLAYIEKRFEEVPLVPVLIR
ncbi:1588_t:CDS:2, partial [Dentiscutata heterogama]